MPWLSTVHFNLYLLYSPYHDLCCFRAADILLHTSSAVNLEVVKSAAVFFGLEDVLSQPPPAMTRGEAASAEMELNGLKGGE